ncbi:MAG TPA: hypothetical protein VK200_13575 [Candidatus Limnocylindrales bacterium]|nr:hypothetical protein [Candidatus Limnocylindrales bacterium]
MTYARSGSVSNPARLAQRHQARQVKTKLQTRNPKQYQMIQKHNIPNSGQSDSGFKHFSNHERFGRPFVSDLDIRISDFDSTAIMVLQQIGY